jgi:hypothetical protein
MLAPVESRFRKALTLNRALLADRVGFTHCGRSRRLALAQKR